MRLLDPQWQCASGSEGLLISSHGKKTTPWIRMRSVAAEAQCFARRPCSHAMLWWLAMVSRRLGIPGSSHACVDSSMYPRTCMSDAILLGSNSLCPSSNIFHAVHLSFVKSSGCYRSRKLIYTTVQQPAWCVINHALLSTSITFTNTSISPNPSLTSLMTRLGWTLSTTRGRTFNFHFLFICGMTKLVTLSMLVVW